MIIPSSHTAGVGVLLVSLAVAISRSAAQIGICYSAQTGYATRYQTLYRPVSYSYSYSCGVFGWSRCGGTRYRSTSYSSSYRQLVYTQVTTCCSGYTGSPPNCQANCPSGCFNGGNCISPGVCNCANGWSGNTCTTPVCPDGCFNGGVCTAPGICTCSSGWTGNNCTQDVDECAGNIDNCDQMCVNELGSYHCECYSGYSRENSTFPCIDINECDGDHGCHHLCNNTDGSFSCYCNPGYMLDSNGTTCEDINECLVDNGGCEFSCLNLEGIGGLPDMSGLDSALDSMGTTNATSQTNLGYQCGCDAGYHLAPNNHDCIDIHNCLIGDHNCSQICVELEGSFTCSCYPGYVLEKNKANCADVDECAQGLAGCSYNCINTPGSFYCTCMSGFELLSDNRTCEDIDECARGIGGCQHTCNNIDGSYYCSCNDGYTLKSDGKYCNAQPCPFLMRPQNGNISCNGEHVTDTTCKFECDLGYGLFGSINRTCLPNNTWSGETTYCDILRCEELQNPGNGSVILPCGQEYGTVCSIECLTGFYTTVELPVQICNVTEVGEVEWTPTPTCQENQLCTPNPCEHSGICNVTGPSSYSCDCNGTRYIGTRCEIGIIEIPDYLPLTILTETKFTLFANPDFELTVQLRAGIGLGFSPSSGTLTFNPTKTNADITITGRITGIYTISYELGGTSSQQFQQPEPSTLIIQPAVTIPPVYFTLRNLEPGMLEAGFCQYATPLDYTCPIGKGRISFSSTCRWHNNASPGLIFSEYRDLNLPVAIAGARITNDNSAVLSRVIPLLENEITILCNFLVPQTSCTFKPSVFVQEIQNFLRTEALAYTFLSRVDQLIPRWLEFLVDTNNTARTHDSTSYMIDLVDSGSLSEIEECSNNIFKVKDGMYSVLKFSGSLNFSINSSKHSITSQGSPICFAVNLCEGLHSPLLITIPNQAQDVVNSLPFAQILRSYGWKFILNSIVISSISFSHELSGFKDDYLFGNQEVTYSFLDSTIIADGRFTGCFSLGTLHINYTLDGRTYMLYDNFDMVFELGMANRWDGFMLGISEIMVSVPIYNDTSVLSLTGDSFPILFSVGGNATTNTRCLSCSDPQGISFKLNYDIREQSTGIWSQVIQVPPKLQFGLPTQFSCPINGFIHFDSSFGLQAFTMSSTCIDLQLGNFPIRNLQNLLYISDGCSLEGLCDLIHPSSVNSDVNIYVWSAFPSSISVLRLGYFMSLLPYSNNRFGIASVISTNTNRVLAKLFQLRVFVLGATLTVEATIDQRGLYFTDMTKVFGMYPAVLAGYTAQTNKWNEAPLNIFGKMQSEFTLVLQREVEIYFNFFIKKYQDRIESSRLSLQRAQEQLSAIQITNMNNYLLFNRSQNDYNDALSILFIANQTLQSIQDRVDQAGEELTNIRMRLDDLCTIRTCPEQCIPTVECKTCVTNVTTPIQDICTVTCTKFRQVKRLTGYRKVYRWGWFKVTRCKSSCICWLWFCKTERQCRTVFICKRYLAMEAVYETVDEPYSTTCEEPCQKGSTTDTIEARCCGSVGCNGNASASKDGNQRGSGIPDPNCVSMNKRCEKTRQLIFDALEAAEDTSAALLRELQEANRNVTIAGLRVMRSMARLATSETLFNQSSRALEEAERIYQIAESAHQRVVSDNGDIQVFIDLMNNTNSIMEIDIFNITFNVTIITESPTTLPLDVSYHVLLLNHTSTRRVNVDFQRIDISLRNAAVTIVEGIFLANGRSRRSAKIARQANTNGSEEQVDSSQSYFEEKCSEIKNLQKYITVLNTSVGTIADMAISTMRSVTTNTQSLANLTATSMELFYQPQSINTTTFTMNFNVTINSTTVESGVSDTELELLDLLQNLGNLSGAVGQDIEVDSFRSWLVQMQNLHNRTATAAGFECFGFSDCLNIVADITEELLIISPNSIADPLLNVFPSAKTALLNIVQSTNNTITIVLENIKEFYSVIGDLQFTNYYCAQPPVIIHQPPQQINAREGSTQQIVCNASSNFSISYKWKRDGIELIDSNCSVLMIEDIQLADTGNYTCEATNHIGTVKTIEISVEVQRPPEFFLEPSNIDVYLGDWNGATFQCNATAWPYPGFTWHFKPKNSGDFMIVTGEVDNEYTIEFPQPEHEGMYYCSASNEQATIQSRIVELTVLKASATQMSQKFTVNFTLNDNETIFMDEDGPDYNDTMDVVNEELRNTTEESIIDLISNSVNLQSTTVCDIEIMIPDDELMISFSLISKNVPYPETSLNDINQLVPLALVEWANVRRELEEWFSSDNLTINRSGSIYTSDPSSVVIDIVQQTCPSGREISLANNFLCVNCPPGTYQTTRVDRQLSADESQGSIVVPQCTECPEGYYQPDQGQISCDKCPPGSTSFTKGSRSCVPWCGPNYYSSTGYEPCSPCPQGSYTLVNGSTACINCSMSSTHVPASICPFVSTTNQFPNATSTTSMFINQTAVQPSTSMFTASTTATSKTISFTSTTSPTDVSDFSSKSDDLSDNEVAAIAVSVSLAGVIILVVLVLAVTVLIILRKRKKVQYNVAGENHYLESSNEETNHTYEFMYPNPTYQDQDHEFSVKLAK